MKLIKSVEQIIKRYHLIEKGDKVILGVSGGPDSMALMYILQALCKDLKLALHIAHVDHLLRPDSGADSRFVEMHAKRLGIPFFSTKVDIRVCAKKGSIEETARNVRLEFFFRLARNLKARKIALGHTLDDQAETVLMRMIRGAGLYGLSGILPKRKIRRFVIVRPLLEVTRSDIELFLKQIRVNPRRDNSNAQDIYFRNKIRNQLIPLLELKYNRNIKEVLASLAQTVASDYEFLNAYAALRAKGSRISLSLKTLKTQHSAIQRLLIRQRIFDLKGDTRRITFRHIKEIEDLIANRPDNSIVDLPKGISVIKKKKCLSFYRR